MKNLSQNLKSKIALIGAMVLTIGLAANAQTGERTATVSMTKTIDGKKTVKEETVTVKEGEDLEEAIQKMEKDFTKGDKEKGEKVNVKVDVNAKAEPKCEDGKKTKKETITIEKENGKEIRKEKKVIIED